MFVLTADCVDLFAETQQRCVAFGEREFRASIVVAIVFAAHKQEMVVAPLDSPDTIEVGQLVEWVGRRSEEFA